ncbi:hypothetical protein I41_19610 [Lacipirellula limnantheis]|uniref:Uncharacterized protein n=1 Tax=Lacipirellula limnantheis TaxID=2528024 RepID=A0A517TWM8_9BACT|nr:hypothetical protein I41_19610 [Lacipirellula limnantheis]
MFCATAAPMRHPPGEAHSLPAPAPHLTAVAGESAHFVGGVSDADSAFHSEPPALLHAASGSETPPSTARNQSCRRPCRRERRRNSNPLNHFGLVSPKMHEATPGDTRHTTGDRRQATQRDTRRHASMGSGAFCHWRRSTQSRLPSGKRLPTPSTSPPSPRGAPQVVAHSPTWAARPHEASHRRTSHKRLSRHPHGVAQKLVCGTRLRRRLRSPLRAVVVAQRRIGVGDPSHRFFWTSPVSASCRPAHHSELSSPSLASKLA